jgi:drug/metabolite transporter (DMT)-like permease
MGFALTLVIQTVAQKYTNATHVAILLSTSGVFGSVAGVIFIGEPMTMRIFIASALILAGVITVEAVPALIKRHGNVRTKGEQLT